MTINIVISSNLNKILERYIRYTGTSKSAVVAILLSVQEIKFRYERSDFIKKYNKKKYKKTGCYSENCIRFSVNVSGDLFYELVNISEELKIDMPKLTTTLIRMELEHIFGNEIEELATPTKDIGEKKDLSFSISSDIIDRLDFISNSIGIPRSSLISHAVIEYLDYHYDEYDPTGIGFW